MAKTGYDYAPSSKTLPPVVGPGEFTFSVAGLDHGHIFGQTNGLLDAGATLKYVFDPDPDKVANFLERYPDATEAESLEQILDDDDTLCVASASIPCDRGPFGVKVLKAGKHYFTDKSPFTTLSQLEDAKAAVAASGKRYMVYFSERLHNESSMRATELIQEGAIGKVLQVINLAPHRLSKDARPGWFFEKDKYGGILTDIGSHQFEQFLAFTGATDGTVNFARVENFTAPDKPGLEDFGEASLTMSTGASCYCRIDWLTPDGLRVWGDGRVFVVGTEGTMEIRKYISLARQEPANKLFLVNGEEEKEIDCDGSTGFPFFGEMILDLISGTENAMTQEHIFKAAELSMVAQEMADRGRA
ncbi:MAG: Gfo/Idh/MocA family oxidoreductase [Verrucomicrobiales bacterium]|nr:Gfo/Idh/MocA family oxidoreductase [Verrucomicrobiales bacterium]